MLTACALVLAAVVAGEAWYLWGASDPTPSAARPVVVGDIAARSAVETAAQDAAAIFTVSWKDYDAHLDRAAGLMTDSFARAYRTTAAPVREQGRLVADPDDDQGRRSRGRAGVSRRGAGAALPRPAGRPPAAAPRRTTPGVRS